MNNKKTVGIDSLLVDNAPQGIIVFDSEGGIVRVNEKANTIINAFSKGSLALFETDLLHLFGISPLPLLLTHDSIEKKLNEKTIFIIRQRLKRNDLSSIVYFLQDISGEKTLVATIHRQTSDSLQNIRSRITSIQNALAILVDYQSAEFSKETFELLVDSRFEIWRLSRYIDNLRDFSLLNANVLEKHLVMENVNIKEVVHDAVNKINAFKANWNKNYSLIEETPGPFMACCDKRRYLRIIESLLFNAIVFSGPDVTVNIVLEQADGDEIMLHIKDNGIGVKIADQSRLFEYGFRTDNGKNRYSQGQGLELYLCRQVMNRMNGSLSFLSKENSGSIFTLSLKRVDQEYR
jgi:signal transduction histidine kinase